MTSTDDLFSGLPVAPRNPAMPTAWQATADNTVHRHYAEAPAKPKASLSVGGAADAVNAQVKLTEHKLDALRSMAREASVTADGLALAVEGMAEVLRGPGKELATAQQALIDLQRRNDALIEQCRSWKQRATTAEKQAKEALEQAQKSVQAPGLVIFHRKRTPGDSVRFLAAEVMKHAEGNIELAGIAVALRMVATDVDSLPQGDHAR